MHGGVVAVVGDDPAEIAWLPDQVRGYKSIELRRAAAYRAELARRLS